MIGMLWYDPDPKTPIDSKVLAAAEYYRKKYGQDPNFCFAHPGMMEQAEAAAGDLKVKARRSVQANHLWIGRRN